MSLAARLRVGILLVIGLMMSCLSVAILFNGTVAAEGLSPNAPHKANSVPNNVHVFYMRKGSNGQSDTTRLDAYYPATGPNAMTNSQWNNTKISISTGPGDDVNFWRVCEAIGSNTNKYITVTLTSTNSSVVYHIPKGRVCTEKSGSNAAGTNSSNAFFASYPLPDGGLPAADASTHNQYYRLEINIAYNEAPDPAGGIRFQIHGGNDNSKIGPYGKGFTFPILAKWSSHTESTTEINIPFGMACDETGTQTKKIGIYDADNKMGEFADNDLTFKIVDTENNKVVKMVAGSAEGHGWMTANRELFHFKTGNSGDNAFAKVTMEEGGKYEMRIKGLDPRNAIDVMVPAGTIFGDKDLCDEGWKIKGNSDVKGSDGEWYEAGDELVTIPYNYGKPGYTGGSIISNAFRHRLKNTSDASTGDQGIAWRIKWGQYGAPGNTYSSGNIDTSTTGGKKFSGKEEMIKDGAGMNNFAIPDDAETGYQYCQYISWWPSRAKLVSQPSDPNYRKDSTPACVTIEREPCIPGTHAECTTTTPNRYVNMEAKISVAGNTETTTDAQFTGYVKISNFPKPEEGGWGYKELSSQHDAERQSAKYDYQGWNSSRTVCPSYSDQGTVNYAGATCSHQETRWSCGGTSGYTSDPGSCEVVTGYSGWYQVDGTTCLERNAANECTKYNKVWTRDTYTTTVNSTSYLITVYDSGTSQYNCLDGSGWSSSCPDRYYCPNGGSGTGWSSGGSNSGWAWNSSQITCNVWQCKYPSASAGHTEDPMKNRSTTYPCSYRCNGSNGDKAYKSNSWDDTFGTEDRRCFVQPKFSLTCYWEDGTSKTVDVSSDGNVCNIDDYYETTGAIGTTATAELKIKNISPQTDASWNPSDPAPGTVLNSSGTAVKMYDWRWTKTDATATTNVVGYSYLKVYGGDVRVGGGVGTVANSGVCNFTPNAEIRTNNQGPDGGYNGSSVQYAAFATGTIDKLISGQYNEYAADPDPGLNPKRLAFAGTSGAYGGNFGSAGPCYDYTGKLSSDAISSVGNTIINGQLVNNGQRVIRHVKGNVFIDGDIVYADSNTGWVEPINIPVYQLIVEGNIYISPNVTRLDGMYVAVPAVGLPTSGNIYTCATGIGSGSVPTTTFGVCKTQLVVNGSLSAKRLFPMRDCGSLALASPSERSISNGGFDQQNCSALNHAAEIVNYSPEMWIRSAIGPARDNYDSLISLPPVL